MIDMKKQQILIIALIALLAFITMPVQAQTITMANPDATMERDIIVYYPNGTMYGFYNTTSVIDLGTNMSDYIFTLKPQYSNPLDNPVGWLNSLMAYVQTHATALLFIAVLIGIALTRKW